MGKLIRHFLCVPLLISMLSVQMISCRPTKPTRETPSASSSHLAETPPSSGKSGEGGAEEPKDITIYLINGLIIQTLPAYNHGAKAAMAELGIPVKNLKSTGFEKGAAEPGKRQAELLKEAVSAKADIIIIDPEESDVLAGPITEVFRAGIPILVIDSKVDTDAYTAFLYSDDVNAGRVAAEELLKHMRANGVAEEEAVQVAIQVGNMRHPPVLDRLQGFTEYWRENAPEWWELLVDDIRMNDGIIATATSMGKDFIADYPNLKGVFAPHNAGTVGFVKALEEAGRTDIALVGFDFSAEIEWMIQDGSYSASTLLAKKYYMGYDAVKLAYDILQGGTPPTEKQIDIGVLVVNRENIDSGDPDILYCGY